MHISHDRKGSGKAIFSLNAVAFGLQSYEQLATGPPRQAPVHSFFRLKPLMKRPAR